MSFTELYGYDFDALKLGMKATTSRTITETDLRNFSGVSGDTNPMHLNEEFAQHTQFGHCIVHGMLTASLLSNVIGNQLPGPGCIYLNQSLKFTAPVYVGDTVYATATVIELLERRRVKLKTQCLVGEKVVIDGEALVWIPERKTP
jgi:3-hydroxybutyryl-CoA dehydratase